MKKIIVIPARGGSKGILHKNIYPLNGKPLLEYTIDMILRSDLEDTDIVVSTDSEEIKSVAQKYKKIYIVNRPASISGDKAKTEDALIHAIDYMYTQYGKEYELVLTLQATSPLRKPQTLIKFIEEFEKNYPEYDAQLSLSENRTDFWIRDVDGKYRRLYPNAPRRRQERNPLFEENSAYYITDIKALRKTKSVLGTKAGGFVIDDVEAVDINEEIDLLVAESLLKQNTL